MKSSSVVRLVLIGTAGAWLGYSALHRDDDSWTSSTQPSSGHAGSGYYHSSHYYGYGRSGSSGGHSGTSRGGFGGSGHAAGA